MVVKTPRNFKVKRRISFKLSKETLGLIFKVINANLYHKLAVLTPFRFPGSRRRDHGPRSQEGRAASEGGTSQTKEKLAAPRHLGDAGRLPLTQKPARGHRADHQRGHGRRVRVINFEYSSVLLLNAYYISETVFSGPLVTSFLAVETDTSN